MLLLPQVSVSWSDLGLSPSATYTVNDLWEHRSLGDLTGSFSASVRHSRLEW